jgi:hypothetical protein
MRIQHNLCSKRRLFTDLPPARLLRQVVCNVGLIDCSIWLIGIFKVFPFGRQTAKDCMFL